MRREEPFERHLVRLADALDDARLRCDTSVVTDLRAQADQVFHREYGSLARHLERLDAPTVMSLLHPTTRARSYVTTMALRASAAQDVGDANVAMRLGARAFELGAALLARDAAALRETVLQRALAAIAVGYVPRRWLELWEEMRARVATLGLGYRTFV